jgi:hypothetical protein
MIDRAVATEVTSGIVARVWPEVSVEQTVRDARARLCRTGRDSPRRAASAVETVSHGLAYEPDPTPSLPGESN